VRGYYDVDNLYYNRHYNYYVDECYKQFYDYNRYYIDKHYPQFYNYYHSYDHVYFYVFNYYDYCPFMFMV
jgi:hypothetical protein